MSGGVVSQISARRLITCPITPNSNHIISPRSFVSYDSSTLPEAGYFEHAILNSFPKLNERVTSLTNSISALFLEGCHRKSGSWSKGSGKTSWPAVFHRLIPVHCVATITKECQFFVAMVDESTQLVIINEWSATSMDSTLAKTILQSGWITTAVKHEQPRSFFNNSPFYITTNQEPDFGKDEQENVFRHIIVYEIRSLSIHT